MSIYATVQPTLIIDDFEVMIGNTNMSPDEHNHYLFIWDNKNNNEVFHEGMTTDHLKQLRDYIDKAILSVEDIND